MSTQQQNKIQKRRLKSEIAVLVSRIADIKQYIKFDPYKQDLPGLRKQLKEAKEDLVAARAELKARTAPRVK